MDIQIGADSIKCYSAIKKESTSNRWWITDLKKLCWEIEVRYKFVPTVWFYLNEVQETAKWVFSGRNQKAVFSGKLLTGKGQKGIFFSY